MAGLARIRIGPILSSGRISAWCPRAPRSPSGAPPSAPSSTVSAGPARVTGQPHLCLPLPT